jgi:hypothetical protein
MAWNSKSGALESGMTIFTGATSGGRKQRAPKRIFFFLKCCLFTTARWYRRVLIGVFSEGI